MITRHTTIADIFSNLFKELAKTEFLTIQACVLYCLLYVLLVVETQNALLWQSRPFSSRLNPLGQEQVYFGEWSLICGAGRHRYSHPPFSMSSSHQFLPSQEKNTIKMGIPMPRIYKALFYMLKTWVLAPKSLDLLTLAILQVRAISRKNKYKGTGSML